MKIYRPGKPSLTWAVLAIAVVIPNLGLGDSLVGYAANAGYAESPHVQTTGPCPPIQTLSINTGFDYSSSSLYPIGAADPNWTVVADPDPNTTEPRPAFVISQISAWKPPLMSSQWISSYPTADDDLNGKYTFEFCFCLRDGFSAPILNLSLRADDQAEVFLNGQALPSGLTPNPSHNTASPHQVPPPAANLFRPGRNCLRVVVQNIGSVAMGLNLSGSITTNGLGLDRPQCCNPNSQIMGTKWNDLDGDGIRDAGELALSGWTITLSNGNTAVTDVHGNYYFTNLPPGTYTVTETQQSGWTQTLPAGGGSHSVTLGANQVVIGRDFANRRGETACNFAATPGCPGQATTFTDLTTGATSWNWNFGDGGVSTVQNPTHVYLGSGSYTVKLTVMVNGHTCTVQQVINVPAAPLPPVISGPTTTCVSGSYTVIVPSGTTVNWTVTNGTITAGQGTPTIAVLWNGTGNGLVAVTLTQSRTCCKTTAQILVPECPCCRGVTLAVSTPKPNYDFCPPSQGYFITPTLTVSGLGNITQITADILSASVSYSPTSCGTGGAVAGTFASPASENGFSATLTVPNGNELVWTANNPSGVAFPSAGLTFNQIKIVLPGPPPNTACKYTLSFCIKYTFTDAKCNTCSIIKCTSFDLTGMPPPNPSPC